MSRLKLRGGLGDDWLRDGGFGSVGEWGDSGRRGRGRFFLVRLVLPRQSQQRLLHVRRTFRVLETDPRARASFRFDLSRALSIFLFLLKYTVK